MMATLLVRTPRIDLNRPKAGRSITDRANEDAKASYRVCVVVSIVLAGATLTRCLDFR
ncbi:hypothetical protein SH528x_006119 [Novipirellula sp. SH528]|uniref:hypothetical protein n=1 Tax=Novipirellula sp. SH528 TaxID=3454466 RepID=UPI003FA075F4